MKKSDEWTLHFTGTIVEWEKSIWIVSKIVYKENKPHGLDLISADSRNTSAFPTVSWPSEESGVRSVKWIANTMKDYIMDSIGKIAFPNL